MSKLLSRISCAVFFFGPRRRLRFVVILPLLLVPLLGDGATGQQQPVFEATVELVQLQVMVGDADGRFMSGLGRDDFQLWVNDEPRDVSLVYEVNLGGRAEAAPVPETPSEQSAVTDLPPAGWRQFLLFFDFSFTSPRGVIAAQEAAAAFVSDIVHPDDLLSVVSYDHLGGLKLLSPFTMDRAQVEDAISELGLSNATRITDPIGYDFRAFYELLAGGGAGTAGRGLNATEHLSAIYQQAMRSDFERYLVTTVDYVNEMGKLGKMLQAARGRKHLVLFSQGFDDKVLSGGDSVAWQQSITSLADPGSRFGSAELRTALDDALEELRRADAVVHAIDTSGLGSESADRHRGLQGLTYFSEGTSGTLTFNTNDLIGALADLEERTRAFYVVAYTREPDDPPVVDLRVEVAAPGAEVVSAPSRLAPPPDSEQMTPAQRQMQLAEYITKGIEQGEMTFSLEAIPFAGERGVARLAVVLEIPWAQLEVLADARTDDRTELEILGYVLDKNGRMLDFFSGGVGLDLEKLRSSAISGLPFRYYNLLWATPGDYNVRALVRESSLGRISTHTIECQVPDFAAGELLVSGPVFIDTAHPGMVLRGIKPASPPEHKAGGPVAYPFVLGEQELTPRVAPVISPGDSLPVLLVAHHLGRQPATGQVQATVSAEAVNAMGVSRNLGDIAIIEAHTDSAADSTSLLISVQVPKDLQRGFYELRVTVGDAVTGQRVGQSASFSVIGG